MHIHSRHKRLERIVRQKSSLDPRTLYCRALKPNSISRHADLGFQRSSLLLFPAGHVPQKHLQTLNGILVHYPLPADQPVPILSSPDRIPRISQH